MKTSVHFLSLLASLGALAAAGPHSLLTNAVWSKPGVSSHTTTPTTTAVDGSAATDIASGTDTGKPSTITSSPAKATYQATCENLANAVTEGVDSNTLYTAMESFCSAIDGKTVKSSAPQTTQVAMTSGKTAELSASLSSGSEYLIKKIDCNVQLGNVVLIECAKDGKSVSGSIMASNSTINGDNVALYSVNIK